MHSRNYFAYSKALDLDVFPNEGFRMEDDKDLEETVLYYFWSPIVWDRGVRLGMNFLFADWCALDYDEGMKLSEAKEEFKDFEGYIGTTLNHDNYKKGVKCDRFRVMIPFDRRIANRDVYKYNMKRYAKLLGSDGQATDAARIFRNCKEIFKLGGAKKMPVLEVPRLEYVGIKKKYTTVPQGALKDFLEKGWFHPWGGRNSACYYAAVRLRESGATKQEAIDMISNSPFSRQEFDQSEIVNCVNSAYK